MATRGETTLWPEFKRWCRLPALRRFQSADTITGDPVANHMQMLNRELCVMHSPEIKLCSLGTYIFMCSWPLQRKAVTEYVLQQHNALQQICTYATGRHRITYFLYKRLARSSDPLYATITPQLQIDDKVQTYLRKVKEDVGITDVRG